MKTYAAIDLHSNNNVLVIIDEQDNILLKRKSPNSIGAVLDALSLVREPLSRIAVESTYNWYWLVDGLQEMGYRVSLVNTSAVKQYEGLKYTDDTSDAFHLAHLLRGEGNRKNGNKYLAWAFIEAAIHAIRWDNKAKQFYQKKAAKTKRVVALKALSHKLARACYYVIKNNEEFDNQRLYAN